MCLLSPLRRLFAWNFIRNQLMHQTTRFTGYMNIENEIRIRHSRQH